MTTNRNSSFELLRIILIILIMMEHCNMWFIGGGSQSATEHFTKCLIESVCIGSVNTFVLISGWFSIRSGLKKIAPLVSMMLFSTVPLLIVALFLRWLPLSAITSPEGIYQYILGGNAYWFVIDYIALIIISPLLNKGFDMMTRKQCGTMLIALYLLIALYDFALRSPVLGVEGGYSLLWFAFLYLLARYMRSYDISPVYRHRYAILAASVFLQSVLFYFEFIGLRYTNPLILLEAVCLILIFKDWDFYNRSINYAATGALMAYLLHMHPLLVPYISRFLAQLYAAYGYWLYMAVSFGMSIVLFVVAVFLNKAHSSAYNRLTRCF